MSVRGGKRAGVNFDFIMGANRVVQSTGQASNFGIKNVHTQLQCHPWSMVVKRYCGYCEEIRSHTLHWIKVRVQHHSRNSSLRPG